MDLGTLAVEWVIKHADDILKTSGSVGGAAVVWREIKKHLARRLKKWTELYENDPKQDGVPQNVLPPQPQGDQAPANGVRPTPLPPPSPAALQAAPVARAAGPPETSVVAALPAAASLPAELLVLQREVELLRTQQDLQVTQGKLRDLRADLNQALLEQRKAEATERLLGETQEDLRRLRTAYDGAVFEHTARAAELTALREHNAQLERELAREREMGRHLSAENARLRSEGASTHSEAESATRLPERGVRDRRSTYQNEGVGRSETTGTHRGPLKPR